MDMEEKKVSSETIFKGKVVTLLKDQVLCPNGNLAYREVIKHPGGAAILCVTENDEILLERQFRYAYYDVIYEIPAGKLEYGENPYDAAMREFEEETGNKAKELIHLTDIYPTCGYSSEIIYLYLAKNYTKTKKNLDEDEIIETELIKMDKVLEMIENGQIRDAKTICALFTYLIKYKK